MSDTMMAVLIIGGIVFAYFLLPRIFAKGFGAVFDAGQKTVFKKQIAESDDLIDVPLVLTSSATPATILDALDAIINPSKEPPGYTSVLYQVSREPMRAVYAIGSKLQPQQLVTELRLKEHDGKTEMVFRVLAAMRTENVFIYKEALMRLREQVQYVAECGADEAKLAEGARIYRADPELAKRQTVIVRAGSIMFIAALFWLGAGVQIRLLPIWFILVAAAGTLIYIGRKPTAKAESESSAAAARVLHPEFAQDAEEQPAAAESVITEPAAVIIPVAEPTAAAVVEPSVAPTTPGAAATAGPGLVARFSAMPQQAKLVVVLGTVITVLIFAVVALVDRDNSRNSYADQSDVYSDDFSYEGEDVSYEGDYVGIEVDPDALSPDTHARMESDLFSSAPADGSMEFAEVVYDGGGDWFGGDEALMEFTIVSRDPAEWYIAVLPTGVGCYIDHEQVSFSDYWRATYESDDHRGMIVFNNEALYELHVFTQGQRASASTPEKDQVTIVPEFMELDLPYAEWEYLEFGDAIEAHDAAVKQAFADVGLTAVIRREPVTDGSEPTQSPRAGLAVPVGTTVHIMIPTSD